MGWNGNDGQKDVKWARLVGVKGDGVQIEGKER